MRKIKAQAFLFSPMTTLRKALTMQSVKSCILLIAALILADVPVSFAAAKAKRNDRKPRLVRMETIIKVCPERIKAVPQPQEGWMRAADLIVKWTNTKIVPVFGGSSPQIICIYELSKDYRFDYSFILPGSNYICQPISARGAECRERPPIKIGGNKKGE